MLRDELRASDGNVVFNTLDSLILHMTAVMS